MLTLIKAKIREKLKENDSQISADGIKELQNSFDKLLNDIIILSKKSAELEHRKRLFPEDIKKGIQMYGETRGLQFLDQLQHSTQEGFKEFFEKKKSEVEQWKQ